MTLVSDLSSEIIPLAGLRILVTRKDTPESSLSAMLKSQGASVITAPMTMIMPPASWESFDKTVEQAAKLECIMSCRHGAVRAGGHDHETTNMMNMQIDILKNSLWLLTLVIYQQLEV